MSDNGATISASTPGRRYDIDALHKLISFQSGAASALPQLAIIIAATIIVTALAVNRFQYE